MRTFNETDSKGAVEPEPEIPLLPITILYTVCLRVQYFVIQNI